MQLQHQPACIKTKGINLKISIEHCLQLDKWQAAALQAALFGRAPAQMRLQQCSDPLQGLVLESLHLPVRDAIV